MKRKKHYQSHFNSENYSIARTTCEKPCFLRKTMYKNFSRKGILRKAVRTMSYSRIVIFKTLRVLEMRVATEALNIESGRSVRKNTKN